MKERLDREGLEAILPHRERALMIDRVEIENDKPVGYYTVTQEVCEGHFPDQPVMRGVDRIEMIGIMRRKYYCGSRKTKNRGSFRVKTFKSLILILWPYRLRNGTIYLPSLVHCITVLACKKN